MNRIYSAIIGVLSVDINISSLSVSVESIYAAHIATIKEPSYPAITIESDARGELIIPNKIGLAPLVITTWSQVSLDESSRIMKNVLRCLESRAPIRTDEVNLTFEFVGNPTLDSVNEGADEPLSFRNMQRVDAAYFFK